MKKSNKQQENSKANNNLMNKIKEQKERKSNLPKSLKS